MLGTPLIPFWENYYDSVVGAFIYQVILSVAVFALLVVPVFTYIAIVRYHLYDIDVVINRTLVYGALTSCVVGIYMLAVVGLGVLFQARGNLAISLLVTGLVAVLFQPLRGKLQRGVNRLMYGERDDPSAVTSRLGRRIEATLAPEAVLPTIAETIAQALKLPYAAILLKEGEDFRTAAAYGIAPAEPEVRFDELLERIHRIIAEIAPADSVERYTRLGVDVRKGHATLVDPWTVEIDGGERLTARAIVIAAGGEPSVPPIPGLAESGYLTSDSMWEALRGREAVPARIAIVGGGPIGTEMAQAFARLGSKVTQIEHGPRLLPREDPEASALVESVLSEEEVEILTGREAVRIEAKRLIVRSEGEETAIPFDEIIVAVGRNARLSGYGLESLGIETGRTVAVNEWLETRFPNIYAVGDVAGPYQFTHFAAHQAWFAAVNGLFGHLKRFRADYRVVPWVTYTDPEVAHVGHNALSAKEAGIAFEVVRYDLAHLDRALAEGANRGFVKMLVQPGKDRLIGATVVAAGAGELLAVLVLAM